MFGSVMTILYFETCVANGTETVAVPEEDGSCKLHGYKWFSSATDANVTFTLVRVMNSCGSTVPVSSLVHLKMIKYCINFKSVYKKIYPQPNSGED